MSWAPAAPQQSSFTYLSLASPLSRSGRDVGSRTLQLQDERELLPLCAAGSALLGVTRGGRHWKQLSWRRYASLRGHPLSLTASTLIGLLTAKAGGNGAGFTREAEAGVERAPSASSGCSRALSLSTPRECEPPAMPPGTVRRSEQSVRLFSWRSCLFVSFLLALVEPFFRVVGGVAAADSSICPPGQFGSAPPACAPCPVNQYGPAPGMSQCMPCPVQATTLGETGATSIGSCSCESGYYLNMQLAACTSCPLPMTEFYCPGGLTANNVAAKCGQLTEVANGGWWIDLQAIDVPVFYQACPVRDACIGGCGQCREGHVGPLCQMCAGGWTRDFFTSVSQCSKCPSKLILLAIHGSSVVGLAIFVYLCFLCANHSAHDKLKGIPDDQRSRFVPAMKMLMVYLTVWGIYGLQANLGETWADVDELGAARGHSAGSYIVRDVFSASPLYFQQYVAAARSVLLFTVGGQKLDCWFSNSQQSPLYVYTFFAFLVPAVLLTLLFLIFNSIFVLCRDRVPEGKKVLYMATRTRWRDVLGQKLTVAFWQVTFSFLFFWLPGATTYFAAAFQCRTLASGEQVQVFDSTVSCGGRSYANATQVALPGLFVWSFGCPILFFLAMLFYVNSLQDTRFLLVFSFLNDFYRFKFFWWEVARLLFLSSLICVAVYPFPVGRPSFLTVLLSLFGVLFALARPYGSESIDSWTLIKRKTGKDIKIPRTLHVREVLMWIDLAVPFQFDSIRMSLPSGSRRRLMEILIVVFFSVGQLLLVGWVLCEIYKTLRYYCGRQEKKKVLPVEVEESPDFYMVSRGDASSSGELVFHKFLLRDELFFMDAVRLSPFPEEALAQLHTFVKHEDLSACDIFAAADFLFEQGHVELQGQTLYVSVPRLASMYGDLTYDVSTSEEFTAEVRKLLRRVAKQLKVEKEVGVRVQVAQRLRNTYRIVGGRRRRTQRRQTSDEVAGGQWKKLIGGETDADVQLRWLRLRMHGDEDSSARRRAEFALIFPSAKPVVYQDELESSRPSQPEEQPGFLEQLANTLFGTEKKRDFSRRAQDPLDVHLHPYHAVDLL
ncbi:hypothetical protein BESB_066500 [Besnoitia besnoiti]|uniref:Tyrosine-protein kinase ephrin type A/B receptor-like domain-containing protein n=1 Tax=Besnoitia besnoiti TaxID=94643 RepID=A0A2A9MG88_BESBE|nr:hypothetical protein BESB_066500 [Besnoitia besnoiti]PFH34617.1 hypothetical protein BESB_066500 [Besnoitia besnoiti]